MFRALQLKRQYSKTTKHRKAQKIGVSKNIQSWSRRLSWIQQTRKFSRYSTRLSMKFYLQRAQSLSRSCGFSPRSMSHNTIADTALFDVIRAPTCHVTLYARQRNHPPSRLFGSSDFPETRTHPPYPLQDCAIQRI